MRGRETPSALIGGRGGGGEEQDGQAVVTLAYRAIEPSS